MKRSFKSSLNLILVIALLFSPFVVRAGNTNKTGLPKASQTQEISEIPPDAEYFFSDSGIVTLTGPHGETATVDSSATVIHPSTPDEVLELESRIHREIAHSDAHAADKSYFIQEEGVGVRQVTKKDFLKYVHTLSSKTAEIGRPAVEDVKANPISLPLFAVARGVVNQQVATAFLIHDRVSASAAQIGGDTMGMMSLGLMFCSKAYSDWLVGREGTDTRFPLQFMKGFAFTSFYLGMFHLSLLAAGQPLEHSLAAAAFNVAKGAVEINLTQLPSTLDFAMIAQKQIKKGANVKRAEFFRNLGYLAMSGFSALTTTMQMSPDPKMRLASYGLNVAVAGPALIYLGLKQDWYEKVSISSFRYVYAVSRGPPGIVAEVIYQLNNLYLRYRENKTAGPMIREGLCDAAVEIAGEVE